MKKKFLTTLLTSALIVSSLPMSALAADVGAATGEGTVFSPTDIIDVVVPTQFKIAVNPLGVAIKNDDFNGNAQILSGTYAIQNRSTIPVTIDVAFKVTGDTKAKLGTAADVVTAENDTSGKAPTAATFSLNAVTTAATQSLSGIANKAADSTDKVRTDTLVSGVKLGKLSTTPIPLAAATTVKVALNAGPYKAVYKADDNKVVYEAPSNAAYDTVGFTFTGTTTTNLALWNAVTTAPKVEATYKLTESTAATYAATPLSPTSKGVIVETGKCDVTVTKSTGAVAYLSKGSSYAFEKAPTLTMDKTDATAVAATNKATLLNLKPGSKADATTNTVVDLGTYAKDEDTGVCTYAINGTYVKDNIEAGFYQVTVGKQSFLMEVK